MNLDKLKAALLISLIESINRMDETIIEDNAKKKLNMKTSAECLLILKELEIIVTRWYEIDRYLYFHVSPSITNNEIEKINKGLIDPEYFISYNCFSVNLEKQLTDIKNPTPIHHFNTKIKNIIETNFQL